jgi:hypothetical protein
VFLRSHKRFSRKGNIVEVTVVEVVFSDVLLSNHHIPCVNRQQFLERSSIIGYTDQLVLLVGEWNGGIDPQAIDEMGQEDNVLAPFFQSGSLVPPRNARNGAAEHKF